MTKKLTPEQVSKSEIIAKYCEENNIPYVDLSTASDRNELERLFTRWGEFDLHKGDMDEGHEIQHELGRALAGSMTALIIEARVARELERVLVKLRADYVGPRASCDEPTISLCAKPYANAIDICLSRIAALRRGRK